MTLPSLLSIPDIHNRLTLIFPEGLEMRPYLVREMAAKTVFVFLYGGMIEGADRYLRPSHVYRFSDDQAAQSLDADRDAWYKGSTKPGAKSLGKPWYADTTREPIRDETIRYGLLDIGAVGKRPDKAVTSSSPIYFLKQDFAALLDPALSGDALDNAIAAWQKKHLTPAARARMALLAASRLRGAGEVTVECPDGTIAKLSAGPSSVIAKAVVEEFAPTFLANPALLWLSESGTKVRHQDNQTAERLGLKINAATVLPDIILANVGESGEDTTLVFIEVVASDGPMNETRKRQLLEYVQASTFPADQCHFGTAFEDRADSAFRKVLPQLAWGTFAWFRTEPQRLMMLFESPIELPPRTTE